MKAIETKFGTIYIEEWEYDRHKPWQREEEDRVKIFDSNENYIDYLSAELVEENAEYDEAKNEQAEVEMRILKLEKMLKNAKIIDNDDISTDVVTLGCKVKVLDIDFDEEMEYMIVGSTEANPNQNKLSDESPVGKALIGAKAGDTVSVESPNGEFQIKIISISR